MISLLTKWKETLKSLYIVFVNTKIPHPLKITHIFNSTKKGIRCQKEKLFKDTLCLVLFFFKQEIYLSKKFIYKINNIITYNNSPPYILLRHNEQMI